MLNLQRVYTFSRARKAWLRRVIVHVAASTSSCREPRLPGPWDFASSSWLAEIIVVSRLKVMFLSKIQEMHHLQ